MAKLKKPKSFAVLEDGALTIHYESAYQPVDGRRNAMCARMWPLARTRSCAPSAADLCEGCVRAWRAKCKAEGHHGAAEEPS